MPETTVKVTLGKFACASLRETLGPDLEAAGRRAMTHYLLKLKLDRPPAGPPKWLDGAVEEPEVSFDLVLDEDTRDLLAAEAERQQTTMDALASHSVFVYLAELDMMSETLARREFS